jgi:hypothetical protein
VLQKPTDRHPTKSPEMEKPVPPELLKLLADATVGPSKLTPFFHIVKRIVAIFLAKMRPLANRAT